MGEPAKPTEEPKGDSPSRDIGLLAQWRLLVIWAVLLGFSYPRPNLWPLAYVALVPLVLVILRGRGGWRSTGSIYLASCIWWVVMTIWLIPVTVPGWLVLGGYCSLYMLLLVWAVRRVDRLGLPMAISLPVVVVGIEWLRCSVVLGGFPWFALLVAGGFAVLYGGHARREERAMAQAFPDPYNRYRNQVPGLRWRLRAASVPDVGETGVSSWRRALRVEALTLNAEFWLLVVLWARIRWLPL